ncbi:hypothetical protein HYW82_03570, partial [Candidatus Peregrinibacteria bacterium]|nr:hypothetical protein [Candidatus Peregrinibacteria bacterium]
DVNEGSGFLLNGGAVRIIDEGYQLDTVYGDFVVGVTGTEYEARINENNKLTITVNEGSVDVYYKGDKITTLEAQPDTAAIMSFDTETGAIIEPPDTDPCLENPTACAPDIPDTCETTPHHTVCIRDKIPPNKPEGCSSGCDTTPPATASLWAFMLTAIAATRRRLQGIRK